MRRRTFSPARVDARDFQAMDGWHPNVHSPSLRTRRNRQAHRIPLINAKRHGLRTDVKKLDSEKPSVKHERGSAQ